MDTSTMIRVSWEMRTIKFKALQLYRQVFQVFDALRIGMINILNTRTTDTELSGTTFCAAVIQIFEALTISMSKVLNRSVIKGGEHGETNFSTLPTFVIWQIKDRLDFPDSLRIASVCKGWREASLSYTKDVKFRGESLPWIMLRSVQGSAKSVFINMSTGEEYTIYNEDFCQKESKTLFSKQGWFLLHTKFKGDKFYIDRKGMGNVFLLNPFTNKKIKLPSRSIFLQEHCCGAFTIKDGKPDLVVVVADTRYKKHLYEGRNGCIRLWIIRVGKQDLWTEHNYEPPDPIIVGPVEIIGQKIYIVSETNTFLIFSLSNCDWIPVEQSWGGSLSRYVAESDKGEVWKFHSNGFTFHRLNDRMWQQVNGRGMYLWVFLKGASKGYFLSKFVPRDVDAFRHYMVESGHVEEKIIGYLDAIRTTNCIFIYIIKKFSKAEWVDMP